ncbi:hypothetical protein QE152_g11172 [Popillia japonica]|uniref:Uncharacterized protein n=1 Tax=Popillia japonica TaxID=7064 RepID=A0AAW1LSU9_POPJA
MRVLGLPRQISVPNDYSLKKKLRRRINSVVAGNSRSKLSDNNVWSFVWTEADRPKSSNEIASGVYHVLSNFEYSENITAVRLFYDGCGEQNKNSTFMGMLCNWLYCSAPPHVKQSEVIFPVVGNSYLPHGRAFGI